MLRKRFATLVTVCLWANVMVANAVNAAQDDALNAGLREIMLEDADAHRSVYKKLGCISQGETSVFMAGVERVLAKAMWLEQPAHCSGSKCHVKMNRSPVLLMALLDDSLVTKLLMLNGIKPDELRGIVRGNALTKMSYGQGSDYSLAKLITKTSCEVSDYAPETTPETTPESTFKANFSTLTILQYLFKQKKSMAANMLTHNGITQDNLSVQIPQLLYEYEHQGQKTMTIEVQEDSRRSRYLNFYGSKDPLAMPMNAIMRSFMRSLVSNQDQKSNASFRPNLSREIGIEQDKIDSLTELSREGFAKENAIRKLRLTCDYLEPLDEKDVKKYQIAQLVNDKDHRRRQVFIDGYKKMQQLLSVDEMKKVNRYLLWEVALKMSYMRSKAMRAEDVDIQLSMRRCQ
ncbi:MAG: hypothetical protein ACI8WB_002675 [Phenylobacterium sp.]|jgi:hypothetical protein